MLAAFEGKVALVTGGVHGFGEPIVRRLVDGGARVVIVDIHHPRAQRRSALLTFYRTLASGPASLRLQGGPSW